MYPQGETCSSSTLNENRAAFIAGNKPQLTIISKYPILSIQSIKAVLCPVTYDYIRVFLSVKCKFEAFSSSNITVQVDNQTGAIVLPDGILFEVNEAFISEEGQRFLESFVPKYVSVLLSQKFEGYISEIIIEGHTDTDGEYMYNLDLSQRRAYAVSEYCLDADKGSLTQKQIKILRKIVTANGRSYSDPIKKNGKVDKDASRRVVFKFRLEDEEMIEAMREILVKTHD